VFLGSGGPGMSSRPFAEATQAEIDREVAKLLREAEKRATELLRGHRSILDALTNLLLEDETVDGTEVYRLAGLPDRSAASPSMTPPTTVAPRAVATADSSHQASGS
jgi:cell division protease FtsH